jgi:hypothetical protein
MQTGVSISQRSATIRTNQLVDDRAPRDSGTGDSGVASVKESNDSDISVGLTSPTGSESDLLVSDDIVDSIDTSISAKDQTFVDKVAGIDTDSQVLVVLRIVEGSSGNGDLSGRALVTTRTHRALVGSQRVDDRTKAVVSAKEASLIISVQKRRSRDVLKDHIDSGLISKETVTSDIGENVLAQRGSSKDNRRASGSDGVAGNRLVDIANSSKGIQTVKADFDVDVGSSVQAIFQETNSRNSDLTVTREPVVSGLERTARRTKVVLQRSVTRNVGASVKVERDRDIQSKETGRGDERHLLIRQNLDRGSQRIIQIRAIQDGSDGPSRLSGGSSESVAEEVVSKDSDVLTSVPGTTNLIDGRNDGTLSKEQLGLIGRGQDVAGLENSTSGRTETNFQLMIQRSRISAVKRSSETQETLATKGVGSAVGNGQGILNSSRSVRSTEAKLASGADSSVDQRTDLTSGERRETATLNDNNITSRTMSRRRERVLVGQAGVEKRRQVILVVNDGSITERENGQLRNLAVDSLEVDVDIDILTKNILVNLRSSPLDLLSVKGNVSSKVALAVVDNLNDGGNQQRSGIGRDDGIVKVVTDHGDTSSSGIVTTRRYHNGDFRTY